MWVPVPCPAPPISTPFPMLPSVLLYRSLLLSLNVISSQVLWISNCEASLLCMCLRVCVRARARNLHREILYRHETHNISRETTERGRWRYRVFSYPSCFGRHCIADQAISKESRIVSRFFSARRYFSSTCIRIFAYICICMYSARNNVARGVT